MFKQDADKCRKFPTKGVVKSEDEGGRGRSLHDFAENSYLLKLRFVHTNPNTVEGLLIVIYLFHNSVHV